LAAVLRAVAGEVPGTSRLIVNEVTNRFTATFGYFLDTQEQQAPFRSRRVVYSTMKGQDVALVELEATYGELVCRGYRPLELASEAPASDEAVLVTGIPSRRSSPKAWSMGRGYVKVELEADSQAANPVWLRLR
jgi:hypothetical protein